ncbi:MAG: FtsW/RodA/SpoVE family cell cycle protein [Lachnospiraceae bacterium]|nr:FtsW/RodA/SpoVE family cell cycle protein [Lachnospiraceae bacterium]
MENIVVQVSKYVIIFLVMVYSLYGFVVFRVRKQETKLLFYRHQMTLMYLMHLLCYLLLFVHFLDVKYIFLYLVQVVFFGVITWVYKKVYRNMSLLVLNHMCFLLSVGFVMIARINLALAIRQFVMVAAGMSICLVVPFIIEKFEGLGQLGWGYAIAGVALLLTVFVPGLGVSKYGSRNWIQVAGIGLQPSEFVKIIFVLFAAGFLSKTKKFKNIVKISCLAAVYVLILVAENDLGGALIFFVAYLSILFVATGQPAYILAGFGGFASASLVAYRFFGHVRTRVEAFRDPWSTIDAGGYQVANSLFAIGTGGWFGMGLGKGLPTSIPVSESDFIFSAISEELGGIFAICLLLVCVSCFIMFVNIAIKMTNSFYKLTAVGLSVIYIFQIFLTVGGAIKFIPSTGVTLPLVSYGGSSVLSTIILFSIIQGMYVLNQKNQQQNNQQQNNRLDRQGEKE